MPRPFLRYLAVVGLFTLGNSSNMFLLLHARELGVELAQVPLLWAVVTLTATVLSVPLASLSDRYGRGRFLLAGYLVYGAIYGLLGVIAESGWVLFMLFAGFGVFLAATEGVEKALVADLAPRGRTGTAFGWFNLTTGLLLLPASIVFGWLYESLGPSWAFGFGAACAWVAAALLARWVIPAVRSAGLGHELEKT
jgi:MFS family permease